MKGMPPIRHILAILITASVLAVVPDAVQAQHSLSFDLRPAYLAPTSSFFAGNNQEGKVLDKAFSAHLKYGFRFAPSTRLGQLYPHTTQGIGIAYNTFFHHRMLGSPVSLYVFQTSRIARLSPALSLDYEWNFGASFGWKKFTDNWEMATNTVTGSRINAYLNLGVFLNWQIAAQWNFTAGVEGTHFSNGNTHYPNAGINTLGVRVGVVRTFGNEPDDGGTRRKGYENGGDALPAPPADPFRPHFSYDLILYGATKTKIDAELNGGYIFPGSFGVLGMNFNPMYNFHRRFRAGLSLDAQWDESANVQHHLAGNDSSGELKFYRPPFREQFSVGVSARAEFAMPIFSINVGIGYNVLQQGSDTRGLYQVLVLKTALPRPFFLHVGYRLSRFSDPDNLMLGIGYRFNDRK